MHSTSERKTMWKSAEVLFDRKVLFNNATFTTVVQLHNGNQILIMEFGFFSEIGKRNFF